MANEIIKVKDNETSLEAYERLENNWRVAQDAADELHRLLLAAAEKVRQENRER